MRARNIKPGFFINEDLAEVDAHGRLLFIGLWCLADREGKLEDRPKRIKGELFRYDGISYDVVDEQLKKLAEMELIIRYEVGEGQYILIPNFLKHQSPHYNEKPSTIPNPLSPKVESASDQGDNKGSIIEGVLPPDSLNPDSLNPDSLKKDTPPTPPGGKRPPKKFKTSLPPDFGISAEVKKWAEGKGHFFLEEHLEAFREWAMSTGKEYADWDATFKRAIRENWGKIRQNGPKSPALGGKYDGIGTTYEVPD